MAVNWTLTLDCHDAAAQAAFWVEALGYADAPPPEGWDSWEDWIQSFGLSVEDLADGAKIEDPDGVLPNIGFLKVPEGKVVKNRLHLDLWVSGGRHRPQDEREVAIRSYVARVLALGATVVEEGIQDGVLDHFLMQDPEGNEFCVV
jgi:hypothetical protein